MTHSSSEHYASIMTDVEGLIFDNDGVLVHTERIFFEVNKKVFDAMGIAYSEEDFIAHTFDTGLGSSEWMKKNGCTAEEIEKFTKQRDVVYRERISGTDIVEPSARAVLAVLKQNYTLCIATNTGREMFNNTRGGNELYQLFDLVVCREDYERTKPAPDAYLAALKAAQLEAGEAIVIEDSPRGIEAAQQAGIRVIAITNPHFPNLKTEKAEYRIGTLAELPDVLNRI